MRTPNLLPSSVKSTEQLTNSAFQNFAITIGQTSLSGFKK